MDLYSHKDSNIQKTWLLMTVFFVLIILIGWLFGYVYNSPEILYFAVGLSILMNFFAYWYSDKVALAMSGARPASRETHLELFRIMENLSITAGLPIPRVYVIHDGQINAFATGRDPKHAAVAVTEGALARLNKNELEGVLAHELSHIGNRDILISSVVVVLAGLIAILADWFLRISVFGGFNRDNDNKQGGAIILVLGLVVAILAPLIATVIRLAVSRKREFLADASGTLLTRYPEGLASALEKISQDQVPMRYAHSGTAHLFISNPFRGKSEQNWFARLFMTHPPIEERIRILRGMRP
ncbi:MAG: zinc metalloprotease HtpX [Candidatus Yanofskybacteria bacterium RIFCSPHIGHO2_01_FULL_43_42]|uniref:Protease HtpX homolog n=1 Tax=Candidatus Yanofskybacteria bacterium RIFCSPLOWO2_01_FULL_43_22 TaxID=1802695 RepID=A0A1F8GEF6_9BACT|nr:MAG: zinc metalloprotease HtpX [Candidatus Yanofskybacteria bacterium RIFCSPHIGHO2_01_FULL_43_42]OGN12393.1 MAG: zinc metalloprotease HtpX [Candidatus Yanofskybacteria bacterium RIFCSPHIGHO2_02_FULL_43_17]OGN23765.1 MAG: zinc metalloprotease HtpX [Candidatus Yanofskybacteria bacterium RIFCSPLOWO2_01_FULL_43_22]